MKVTSPLLFAAGLFLMAALFAYHRIRTGPALQKIKLSKPRKVAVKRKKI